MADSAQKRSLNRPPAKKFVSHERDRVEKSSQLSKTSCIVGLLARGPWRRRESLARGAPLTRAEWRSQLRRASARIVAVCLDEPVVTDRGLRHGRDAEVPDPDGQGIAQTIRWTERRRDTRGDVTDRGPEENAVAPPCRKVTEPNDRYPARPISECMEIDALRYCPKAVIT
jgi:hypothetical protein